MSSSYHILLSTIARSIHSASSSWIELAMASICSAHRSSPPPMVVGGTSNGPGCGMGMKPGLLSEVLAASGWKTLPWNGGGPILSAGAEPTDDPGLILVSSDIATSISSSLWISDLRQLAIRFPLDSMSSSSARHLRTQESRSTRRLLSTAAPTRRLVDDT